MTAAKPVEQSSPWPVPPQNGYTVDDLFTLPDLPPHTELIDGSLVFGGPQRRFHGNVVDLLVHGLRSTLPADLRVSREMTIVLDRRNGPEPDVCVIRAAAITGPDQTHYEAADVLLAVEVVSPESEARDRTTKPRKYAAAGIPHFWRVERNGDTTHPVVHTYTLDPLTKAYVHTGMHRDQLKVTEPYDVTVDLTAVDRL
ncbi:Uma2 family endonuclease [Streptomyces fragilis]|uniref:Uma2 family endonuclease n=1 Tax=Streptomyces fragilis TaxID=67301 RepID=A0ABV2YGJ2_9ACTN|nr:Uma2 family endonuclease [Streptomyces fragilis]